MSLDFQGVGRFSFRPRPLPVPGDLRISWRLAVILLMLESARAKRASLAKLHILNESVRSKSARATLEGILDNNDRLSNWQMRIEPAFGRAINFLIGEGLAEWTRTAQRSGLQLNKKGLSSVKALLDADDTLVEEKQFLSSVGKRISEEFVTKILFAGRG
jgi:hypothetical protein